MTGLMGDEVGLTRYDLVNSGHLGGAEEKRKKGETANHFDDAAIEHATARKPSAECPWRLCFEASDRSGYESVNHLRSSMADVQHKPSMPTLGRVI